MVPMKLWRFTQVFVSYLSTLHCLWKEGRRFEQGTRTGGTKVTPPSLLLSCPLSTSLFSRFSHNDGKLILRLCPHHKAPLRSQLSDVSGRIQGFLFALSNRQLPSFISSYWILKHDGWEKDCLLCIVLCSLLRYLLCWNWTSSGSTHRHWLGHA